MRSKHADVAVRKKNGVAYFSMFESKRKMLVDAYREISFELYDFTLCILSEERNYRIH
jgi:hypothetical protein